MQAVVEQIPYTRFLGIEVDRKGSELTIVMPFRDHLVGNVVLPAIHGGAIGAFLELTALAQLSLVEPTRRVPKTIDITIEYLRSGRAQGTYARAILRVAAWRNRVDNLLIMPCGAGDAPSVQRLSMPVKRKGSYGFGLSHLGPSDHAAVVQDAVLLTTVDAIVESLSLERLDFLKADIEGWELRMLHGARKSLSRFRPALMLELDATLLPRAGDTMIDALGFLAELGYRQAKFVNGRFIASEDESEFWLPREKLDV
jgi:FkbM family methyltransferase